MTHLYFGIFAFVFYFIYDLNGILWKNKILQKSFFIGCGLLLIGTLTMIFQSLWVIQWSFQTLVGLMGSLVCLGLLIYTLFFALPFEQTYVEEKQQEQQELKTYTEGVYALCRHPGVLWFIGFYLFLMVLMPTKPVIYGGILFAILNFSYIVLQDYWTFLHLFSDYSDYKRLTPFLIPNKRSIARCFHTLF